MKSVSVFLLLTSLIALSELSGLTYAADDDADGAVAESAEADDSAEVGTEDEEDDDEGEESSSANIEGTTSYSASVSDSKWKSGRCYKDVTVKGPSSIDDVIPVDCQLDNFVLTNNTMLVVGGALFSNTPNTLVVVRGARCEKRTYSQSGGSTPETTRMNAQECAAVRRTMAEVRRETEAELSSMVSNLQNGMFGSSGGNTPFGNGNLGNGLGNLGEGNSGSLFGNRPTTGGANPGSNFMNNFGFGI